MSDPARPHGGAPAPSTTWTRQGLLIEAPPPLAWAASHAALPVVAPMPGGLRLFVSTRDVRGRSQVASGWLDLVGRRASFDGDAAVPLGPLGAFDDNGATSSCVVIAGERVFLYYTGWNLGVTVPFYLAIGCAVSEDAGATFSKAYPAPVLERSAVDPFLTASPSVLVENSTWRMWYVSGSEWFLENGEPKHRYHIKYAESDDGLSWRPTGHTCIDYRDEAETSISRPCVIKDGGVYRMWFSARGAAYRIGYAESSDGLAWTRKDEEIHMRSESEEWESHMQAYPFVFDYAGRRHMLYNGNDFGATGVGHAVLETESPGAASR